MSDKYNIYLTLIVAVALLMIGIAAIDTYDPQYTAPKSTTVPTEETIAEATCVTEPVETTEPETEPPELEVIVETECTEPEIVYYFTEDDAIVVAKVLWEECRGVKSVTQQACVAWTIVNRVDAGDSKSIYAAATKPNQFAWNSSAPVTEELYDLAEDVLIRWSKEKSGYTDVGRVLPDDYLWFRGDGEVNYFRNRYSGDYEIWDYSLPSPYES